MLVINSLEVNINTSKSQKQDFLIWYLVLFKIKKVKALINFYNKINTMNAVYAV